MVFDKHETRYIVAVLDLLGASEKINSEESERVMNIISYMFECAEEKWPYVERAPIELHQIKCVTFSDNIALALELPENETLEETKKKIQSFLTYISVFQGAGLAYDYLFRGGIAIGKLYIDPNKNFIWGKALVDAHVLEEKVAIFPRVVLGHTLEKFDISEMERISKDFDGIHFVEYWSKVKEKTPRWIENNRKMIKDMCEKNKERENVWQKYGWLKYHMECNDEITE